MMLLQPLVERRIVGVHAGECRLETDDTSTGNASRGCAEHCESGRREMMLLQPLVER